MQTCHWFRGGARRPAPDPNSQHPTVLPGHQTAVLGSGSQKLSPEQLPLPPLSLSWFRKQGPYHLTCLLQPIAQMKLIPPPLIPDQKLPCMQRDAGREWRGFFLLCFYYYYFLYSEAYTAHPNRCLIWNRLQVMAPSPRCTSDL